MVIIVIHLIVWFTVCFTNSISSSFFFANVLVPNLRQIFVFSNLAYSFLFLYYVTTVIYLKMHIDLCVLLSKLLGFIGGFLISISPFLIRFFLNGPCFTLFITYISDDG